MGYSKDKLFVNYLKNKYEVDYNIINLSHFKFLKLYDDLIFAYIHYIYIIYILYYIVYIYTYYDLKMPCIFCFNNHPITIFIR